MQTIGQRGVIAAQTGIEPRQSTGIHARARRRTNPHVEPKIPTSQAQIRRESLYPAELSGLERQIVELFARGIEVL
jgi:hypothetical protein